MKVLRVIGNVLIGIILFCLIFALTFTRSTKKFLEKDLILGVVKGKITETIETETGKLTDKSEKLIDDMLEDNSSSEIIRMVIDNFDNYQKNRIDFKVSDKDIETIYSYATKYKNTIVEISGNKIKDISDAEFKKIFSSENINALANDIFGSIDKDLGDNIDIIVKVYSKATSTKALVALIISIVFFILLLLLINWSLHKWMLIVGIDLIVSSVFILLLFIAGVIFNDVINSVDIIKEAIGEINLIGYVIWGSIELIVGILLIILYHFINKKAINK